MSRTCVLITEDGKPATRGPRFKKNRLQKGKNLENYEAVKGEIGRFSGKKAPNLHLKRMRDMGRMLFGKQRY